MVFRYLTTASLLLAFVITGSQFSFAQTTDPHQLYEQHCARCHVEHAGEFVHVTLKRQGNKVVGRETGLELGSFLKDGHGKLESAEAEVMVAHLASILETEPIFHEKCLICHGRAVTFVRFELILRNGRVIGRYTGRDIEAFLNNHGRLAGSEIPTIVRMMERQLASP
ncbi:MAG: hypothetical protein ISR52_02750 [Rhodospirillales bacterium]|nr:hypothetical protein [Rhodospirillales bacterium]